MSVARHIRHLWREVEDILTAATGPLLIVSSAISTSDIFANQTFSHLVPWLPWAWAIARALAVTMWLGIAFDFYLKARRRGEPGGWWLCLSTLLFAVDLQTATLYAFEAEHISNLGEWAILQIPPIDWAIEQATLGVILIAVHRAVIHQAETAAQPASAVAVAPVVRPPVLEPLYLPDMPRWPAQQPNDESGGDIGDEDGVTGHTTKVPRRRGDSGSSSANRERQIARLVSMLRKDPKLSLTQIMERLHVARTTAVDYRDNARAIIAREDVGQV